MSHESYIWNHEIQKWYPTRGAFRGTVPWCWTSCRGQRPFLLARPWLHFFGVHEFNECHTSNPGWWLGHPSEKYEFVNWDDDRNPIWMGKYNSWQPNHQPESICLGAVLYVSVFLSFRQICLSIYHHLSIENLYNPVHCIICICICAYMIFINKLAIQLI